MYPHLSMLHFQHAHALELLSNHLKKGNRAMDVGSGSGYLTACMGHMVRLLGDQKNLTQRLIWRDFG